MGTVDEELCAVVRLRRCSKSTGNPHEFSSMEGLTMHVTAQGSGMEHGT